jgi:hypothetical protein
MEFNTVLIPELGFLLIRVRGHRASNGDAPPTIGRPTPTSYEPVALDA